MSKPSELKKAAAGDVAGRKFWEILILVAALFVGALIIASWSDVEPFIRTLF